MAGSSSATTLGNINGRAWIGRPLSISLPVQLDPGEVASSVCAKVDLYFADNRVDASQVHASWQNPAATGQARLLVESRSALDEPMVTVQVALGCDQALTRKYLLLADLPNEPTSDVAAAETPSRAEPVAAAALASASASADAAGQAPSILASRSRASSATEIAHKAAAPSRRAVSSKTKLGPNRPAANAAVPTSAATASGETSRLKLEPLRDLNPALKATLELRTSPVADNDPARVNARALWRSLNAQPEELSKDLQRLAALETQVKELQAGNVKEKQAEAALKAELSNAENDKYANAVVGLLAAILLCALGVAIYMWLRLRHASGGSSDKAWWRGQSVEPSVLSDLAPAAASTGRPRSRDSKIRTARNSLAPETSPTASNGLLGAFKHPASKAEEAPVPDSNRDHQDSRLSRSGFFHSSMGSRSVNVEELFDVQQQAEFFVSLGQHEQAIELLKHHIYGATSTSGVAYLDLLQLYHRFNRREEYDNLRDEFNRLYNAKVPEFDKYQQQARGLGRYPNALNSIETHWNKPEILGVLEGLIFRHGDGSPTEDAEAFDLEAYRELLMLFAVAKEVSEDRPGASPSTTEAVKAQLDAMSTGRANLSDSMQSRGEQAPSYPESAPTVPAASEFSKAAPEEDSAFRMPKPSPRLGLDVDLFELEGHAPAAPDSGLGHETLDFMLPDASETVSHANPGQSPAPGTHATLPPLELDLSEFEFPAAGKKGSEREASGG